MPRRQRGDGQAREGGSVPTDHNLRDEYADWHALEQACQEFMADVNMRQHRATLEAPLVLVAQEHGPMYRLPRVAHTLCFGQTRKVDRQATVSLGEAIYWVQLDNGYQTEVGDG